MDDLAGKVALVTGAGSGIGRAGAIRLAREAAFERLGGLDILVTSAGDPLHGRQRGHGRWELHRAMNRVPRRRRYRKTRCKWM